MRKTPASRRTAKSARVGALGIAVRKIEPMSEEQILERVEKCLRRFVENGGKLTPELKEDLRIRLVELMRPKKESQVV